MSSERSKRLSGLSESSTVAFFGRVREMQARGEDVISLATGELAHSSPEAVRTAGHNAIDDDFTFYTVNTGIHELRQAIAEQVSLDKGYEYSPSQVLVSCGAKHALFNVLCATLDPGDEVVIFSPYYVSFPEQVKLLGAVPVVVEATYENEWQPTREQIEAHLTGRTRAIIVNTPNNPTGMVFSAETMDMLGQVAVRHGLLLFCDEIYERIVFPPNKHHTLSPDIPELAERLVFVSGFSKSFAMTGWRIGYAYGPPDVIRGAATVQAHTTNHASSIGQRAALAALRSAGDFAAQVIADLEPNRKAVAEAVADIEGIRFHMTQGAFYLWLDCASYLSQLADENMHSTTELAEHILVEHRVAVMAGAGFGAPTGLRVSFAGDRDRVAEGCRRLRDALVRLTR